MTDMNNLSGWSVDRVRVNRTFSKESLCFRAEVFLDGKHVAYAFNEGHGGQTGVTLKDKYREAVLFHEGLPGQLPRGLPDHVDRLVEDVQAVQDLMRCYKRWAKLITVKGRYFVLVHSEREAWESGKEHQESSMPPFRVYSELDIATKSSAHEPHVLFGPQNLNALWQQMLDSHKKWKAMEGASGRDVKPAKPTPPRDPFLGNHYVRNPEHAEEIRRMEIGRTLEFSQYGDLPLTATARLEAMKLLGGAGMLVDDEILTRELLELYIKYVVQHLPRTPTDMVDD